MELMHQKQNLWGKFENSRILISSLKMTSNMQIILHVKDDVFLKHND